MIRTFWGLGIVLVIVAACWRVAVRVELSWALDDLAAGEAQQALERFERLRSLGVDSAVIDFNAGMALLELEQYGDAAARFRLVAESEGSRDVRGGALFGAGNAEALAGRYREAAEAYRESLRSNSDDDDTRFNLAWAMMRLQEPPNPPPHVADEEIDSLDNLTSPLRFGVPRVPNAKPPVDAR